MDHQRMSRQIGDLRAERDRVAGAVHRDRWEIAEMALARRTLVAADFLRVEMTACCLRRC
jgi:hypothetical protein